MIRDRSGSDGSVITVGQLLDALPRAVIIVDRRPRIIHWNQVAEAVYGWRAGEAAGSDLYELITPPELAEAGRAVMAGVLAGQPWRGDLRVMHRDGSRRTVAAHVNPLLDDGAVVGALVAADDVTDLRRIERDAATLGDHLVLALEAGHLGTWRWDASSGATSWDDTMHRLFGLEPGNFGGTFDDWVASLHPDDGERVLSTLQRAVADRSAYDVEHRVVWPDGSIHWIEGRGKVIVDEHGDVVGTIGCSIDITDRKTAEQAAAERAAEAERLAWLETLQRERLEFLAELNDVILVAVDHADLMRRAAAVAVPRLGDWCAVHFTPQPGAPHEIEIAHSDLARVEWAKELRERYPYDPDSAFGVPAVLRTGRTEFLRDIDRFIADPALAPPGLQLAPGLGDVIAELRLTSTITVPLRTKRGVVGAIQFVSAESGRSYDDDDLALAEAVAGRIASALDSAWTADQERDIAVTLQSALLPHRLPDIDGIDVAVRYWAAGAVSEVGGDFYDVFAVGDNRWAVVIGDVCGTGAEAAAITAIARHTIRAAAIHGASPTEVLHWVNRAVLDEGSGRFCTLLYSTLEPIGDGGWRWVQVTGGHPLPIVVDPDGRTRHVGAHGTLIGALPAIRISEVTTDLPRGSTVVLHTDGVNDVRPPYGLDDDRLESIVADAVATARAHGSGSAAGHGADAIAAEIGVAIERVLPIPERDDDMAVVVLRIV